MLSYLVSSKGRRRLLTLLWVEHAGGTATQLAKRARVSFATAYRELQSMKRWDLVRTMPSDDGEVFTANDAHPQAGLLAELASPEPQRRIDPHVDEVRAQLAHAGAPLRADLPTTQLASAEDLILESLQAARRDPEVARVLPVFLFQQRQRGLDVDRLADRAGQRGSRHVLGFFLALTARLSNDAALAKRARALRDRRVKNQDLFLTTSSSRTSKAFALARAWGLRMRADADWFESLFRKFVTVPAGA
jgi:hypothetical protein